MNACLLELGCDPLSGYAKCWELRAFCGDQHVLGQNPSYLPALQLSFPLFVLHFVHLLFIFNRSVVGPHGDSWSDPLATISGYDDQHLCQFQHHGVIHRCDRQNSISDLFAQWESLHCLGKNSFLRHVNKGSVVFWSHLPFSRVVFTMFWNSKRIQK